jgi:exosortase F-associated protein
MTKYLKFILIVVLVLLLFLLRANEAIFHDPFVAYFKLDYLTSERPDYSFVQLLLSHSIRYDINAIISLSILYVLFKDRDMIKFSLLCYIIAFIVLFPLYYYLLEGLNTANYQTAFYVRRFLIQPLLLLVLVPAFFYQKYKN